MTEPVHPSSLPPYTHQKEAENRLRNNSTYALLMDMGTGKTRPVIRDWWERAEVGTNKSLLVVAPAGSYANWIGELEKWLTPEEHTQIRVFLWVSSNTTKTRQRDLDAFFKFEGPKVLIINVEAVSQTERARVALLKFLHEGKVVWVIDESTCIKQSESKRTEFILDAAHLAPVRRILTGLIAPECPLDLFSQFWFLDWKTLGFRSYYAFRARYAILQQVDFRPASERIKDSKEGRNNPRKVTIVVGYRHEDELRDKVAAASYRVLKSDVLDLPPKVYMPVRNVEMTDEQERMYREMKKFATTQLNGQYVTAKIAADVMGKLHAILCGHVRDEERRITDIPSHRVEAVLEAVQDHSGKAIIWAPYPRLLEKITVALRKEYSAASTVEYWGATSTDDRGVSRQRIQEDSKCRWIVSNQSVGGEGNTWTAATLSVYAANSWKNKDRQQSEDRPHRAGQTETCVYVDLAVDGTIEHKLIRALRGKMDLAGMLMGDGWREWLI